MADVIIRTNDRVIVIDPHLVPIRYAVGGRSATMTYLDNIGSVLYSTRYGSCSLHYKDKKCDTTGCCRYYLTFKNKVITPRWLYRCQLIKIDKDYLT